MTDTTATSAPAAAPAPAASPAPATTTTDNVTESPATSDGFDFEAIFSGGGEQGDLFGGDEPKTQPAADLKPPQPEAEALSAPPVAPPSAEAKPSDSVKAAEVPVPPKAEVPDGSKPPAAPMAAQFDPLDPVQLHRQLVEHEAEALEFVATNMFKLSPQETEALEADVIGTIPKLLARVFVRSQQNVLDQMGRMIPTMVQRHLDTIKRNTANEDKFYGRWPDVKRDLHHDSVTKFAAVYRQMHPQATLEQMIEDLGPMIMMANKIVPQVVAPGAMTGQSVKPVPAAAGTNGRSPPPSPFVPAGAGPASGSRAVEQAPWEAMFNPPE